MAEVAALWSDLQHQNTPLGIVGLGYVGLPLACLMAKKFKVIGFDIKDNRVAQLRRGKDVTNEVTEREELLQSNLVFTSNLEELREAKLFIVTVPTPIDQSKNPDLNPLISASRSVGSILQPGSIVIYESTVYPGLTETICRHELEETSGLMFGRDFKLGYSPERVNPGDKEHTIDKVTKVVSASDPEALEVVENLYRSVVTAGVHVAPSIATAEAAKVIENVQRDLNIALVNELAILFEKVGLDTLDVLEAAGTKWNFLKFRPGLVGGHCIGVDPYYLTHLAETVGFHPQVISAGRRINDSVSHFVAHKTLECILKHHHHGESRPLRVGILGVTFKEDVPDLRNTKVVDLGSALISFGVEVMYVDPIADSNEFREEYGVSLTRWDDLPVCDALIIAIKHRVFLSDSSMFRFLEKLSDSKVVVDIKGALDRKKAAELGLKLWRL